MVKDLEHDSNATRDSRIAKTRAFMRDRRNYMARMVLEIARHKRRAIAAERETLAALDEARTTLTRNEVRLERM